MREMEKEHVYEQTYKDYLNRIAGLDFNFIVDTLGVKVDGQDVIILFFGKPLPGICERHYRLHPVKSPTCPSALFCANIC